MTAAIDDPKSLVSAFALAVTCEAKQQPKAWIARKGRFSLQKALQQLFPEVLLSESEKRSRVKNKIAAAAFLKVLEIQCGFGLIRIRRQGLASDAGNILFCGRRWLNPSLSSDRDTLESNYNNLCQRMPAFKARTFSDFSRVVEDSASSWSNVLSHIRTPKTIRPFRLHSSLTSMKGNGNTEQEEDSPESSTEEEQTSPMEVSSLVNDEAAKSRNQFFVDNPSKRHQVSEHAEKPHNCKAIWKQPDSQHDAKSAGNPSSGSIAANGRPGRSQTSPPPVEAHPLDWSAGRPSGSAFTAPSPSHVLADAARHARLGGASLEALAYLVDRSPRFPLMPSPAGLPSFPSPSLEDLQCDFVDRPPSAAAAAQLAALGIAQRSPCGAYWPAAAVAPPHHLYPPPAASAALAADLLLRRHAALKLARGGAAAAAAAWYGGVAADPAAACHPALWDPRAAAAMAMMAGAAAEGFARPFF